MSKFPSHHSKRIRKSFKKRLSFWKTTNLFSFKPSTPTTGKWMVLRTDKISRALQRNVDFLKQVGVLDADKLISMYIYQFERTCFEKGVLYACKYFKSIYSFCQRYAVSHRSEPLPFTKVTKLGIPTVVAFLSKLLKGELTDRRNGLQILSLYKLVNTNNDEIKYESITSQPLIKREDVTGEAGSYFDQTISKFPDKRDLILRIKDSYLKVLERNFPRRRLTQRRETLCKLSDIHISGKSGPNGPSLTHSALDFVNLRDSSPGLLNSIKEIIELTDNNTLRSIVETFEGEDGITIVEKGSEILIDSKLSLKQEVGGKNRVFAIGDWFTQSALKGLHKYLFIYLDKLKEDGTSDHNLTAIKSKEWTTIQGQIPNVIPHSVDLTTATDRLPALLQKEIVCWIFGEDFSNHWYELMTNRNFKKINESNFVQYSTGQPMGLLSSWAMLALTHHIILQTILHFLRISRIDTQHGFVNYLIIGDDVAMRGKNIYDMYIFIVTKLLDVPISELKGFTPSTLDLSLNPIIPNDPHYRSTNELVAIEIAKRVFVNGFEVTPISPVALQMGFELPSDFPSLLNELDRRGYDTIRSVDSVIALSKLNFNSTSALSLASFPLSCAPQLEGITVLTGDDRIFDKSPWLKDTWSDSDKSQLIKLVSQSLRNRLNTGIGDVYSTIIPYMDYDCIDDPLQMKGGYQIVSQGLNILLNYVYRKCQDLVTDWATDFSKEGTREFWIGNESNPVEFKRYLGRMHVIFDITIALQGTSQVLDEKRFSSKFLMEIVKDFLKLKTKSG